jgi:putative component of toxin-antitoxin plasmid stabilization module
VDDLGRYAGGRAQSAARVSVALAGDALKAGENVVELRLRDGTGRRGGCLVSEVAVEIPQ